MYLDITVDQASCAYPLLVAPSQVSINPSGLLSEEDRIIKLPVLPSNLSKTVKEAFKRRDYWVGSCQKASYIIAQRVDGVIYPRFSSRTNLSYSELSDFRSKKDSRYVTTASYAGLHVATIPNKGDQQAPKLISPAHQTQSCKMPSASKTYSPSLSVLIFWRDFKATGSLSI